MDDLNQTQVVLLCLLVSFITSIGTGIITSSLLQEAPQNVTQTINRVVERTVETIVPQETSGPSVITRETTVVVKEEDLVIDAIKNGRNNLVWIVEGNSSNLGSARTLGVVIHRDGTILSDKRYINSRANYSAIFLDGTKYPVEFVAASKKTNAVFVKLDMKNGPTRSFNPATVGNSNNLQLGQTVIAMGGKEREAVSIGRLIGLTPETVTDPGTSTSTKVFASIETDTPLRDTVAGSVLLNLNGDLVGFENYEPSSGRENSYTGLSIITLENPTYFGE